MDRIIVKYKEENVGLLTWDNKRDAAIFDYTDSWISKGIELSPVLMKLSKKSFSFPDLGKETFKGLPPLISDSLPDKFGSRLMQHYLNVKKIDEQTLSKLFRLTYVANRGPGALEYIPSAEQFQMPDEIKIEELQKLVKDIYSIKSLTELHYNEESLSQFDLLMNLGGSVGGARPKLFIGIDEVNKIMVPGDLPPREGMKYHLIKINTSIDGEQSDNLMYGRLEYAYHLMAKDCKIDMMDCHLWKDTHFYTERFDRDSQGNKHHYQTFNSFFGADFHNVGKYRYEDFMSAMVKLSLPQKDMEQMFRRMCFNVLSFNKDDHTKNFSLIMKEDNKWRLAPAYDLCYSYDPRSPWVSKHNLTINFKSEEIEKEDLLTVADKFSIKDPEGIIENIKEVVSNFLSYTDKLDLPRRFTQPMMDEIYNQPLFNENSKNLGR
jgi:serine/threonine-protein kinase HipA